MFAQFIILFTLGILAGTFTGLVPGIHINLISGILIYLLPIFPLAPMSLVVFIVAMSITHTFLDFIPSIFLGAPEEDTFLSVLPGHQMLMQGRGYEAALIASYGSLTGIFLSIIFTPLIIIISPLAGTYIRYIAPFILIFVSAYIILREKKVMISLLIFILAGLLGYITLNLPLKQPLLPLLTGLFGTSSLIISIKTNAEIKNQLTPPLKQIMLTKKEVARGILASLFSPFMAMFPAIGSGQSTMIGSELVHQNQRSFLFLNGIINSTIMVLSFVVLYSLQKSRTGSAAAVSFLLENMGLRALAIILFVCILSAFIAFFLNIYLAKKFILIINKINYKKISILLVIFLFTMTLIISNPIGVLILITSTALGVYAILLDVRRVNLMSCLLVPTIIYYLSV